VVIFIGLTRKNFRQVKVAISPECLDVKGGEGLRGRDRTAEPGLILRLLL
jgi:hypothetical protein